MSARASPKGKCLFAGLIPPNFGCAARQRDSEYCPPIGCRLDCDRASQQLVYPLMDKVQTQASVALAATGCDKRIEDTVLQLRINTTTIVCDFQCYQLIVTE